LLQEKELKEVKILCASTENNLVLVKKEKSVIELALAEKMVLSDRALKLQVSELTATVELVCVAK